ncbi:ubiquitin-protein transferase activating protein [Mactra antiquata]
MSKFAFENMVSEITKLDAPLQSGPKPRWMRKVGGTEQGLSPKRSTKPLGLSPCGSAKKMNGGLGKSPARQPVPQQRGRWKTPNKSSPQKKVGQQDRFIPSRVTSDRDLASYALSRNEDGNMSEYQKKLGEAMKVPDNLKVLSYQENKPKPAEGYANNLQVLYSKNVSRGPGQKTQRVIPKLPERVLDAPELIDDYCKYFMDSNTTLSNTFYNKSNTTLSNTFYNKSNTTLSNTFYNKSNTTLSNTFYNTSNTTLSNTFYNKSNTTLSNTFYNKSNTTLSNTFYNKSNTTLSNTFYNTSNTTLSNTFYNTSNTTLSNTFYNNSNTTLSNMFYNTSNTTLSNMFYNNNLNILDWSSNNHVCVVLDKSVYIWDASSGAVTQLMSLEEEGQYLSSVKAIDQGNILSIGNSLGQVELWDISTQKRVRTMTGHDERVGSLSWNSHIVSSGSRSGAIHHHDVRIANHLVGVLSGHSQDVCGLSWSPDGRYLASGGNDNILHIWGNQLGTDVSPMLTLTHHQAAVKALAWCPWQPNILASGGGTADRQIRIWNINNGTNLQSVDAKSQVCAVLWSKEYKELISGHGYSQNQLTLWKYPEMTKVVDLEGHKARVLNLAMSPDMSMVVSAAADQTLRVWNCFATDKEKTKKVKQVAKMGENTLLKASNIR